MKMMKIRKYGLLVAAGVFLIAQTSCSMQQETFLSTDKIEVAESDYTFDIDTDLLTADAMRDITEHYLYNGDGPVEILVSYNPAVRNNTAMKASDAAANAAAFMRKNGVKNIKTNILPVHKSEASKAYFSYTIYSASAPEGCGDLHHLPDQDYEQLREYELGCTIMQQVAQQISKPKDLIGMNEIEEEQDARRRGNNLDSYKWNSRNGALNGQVASQL